MAAQLNFLQLDALCPLPGATDVTDGFTRVPLTLCPAFSGAVRGGAFRGAARAAVARVRRRHYRRITRARRSSSRRVSDGTSPQPPRTSLCCRLLGSAD